MGGEGGGEGVRGLIVLMACEWSACGGEGRGEGIRSSVRVHVGGEDVRWVKDVRGSVSGGLGGAGGLAGEGGGVVHCGRERTCGLGGPGGGERCERVGRAVARTLGRAVNAKRLE